MTDEIIRLTVSDCIKSYKRSYWENFELKIPVNSSVLEFSFEDLLPKTAFPPVVLWNRMATNTTHANRGRLIGNGKVWLAERVTKADRGNYTFVDDAGVILSRSTLTVHARLFNVTRHPMESLNLPLFLPVPHTHLIFTPTRQPDGSMQLIEEGRITEHYYRHRGLISVVRNGTKMEVVIRRLTSRHDGVYDIRDNDGNLVSSTFLQVVERIPRWRAVLKSITVPSGMFVALAGFILFMKRYPACSISKIIAGLRTNRTPPADPPTINIQDYRQQPSPQPSGVHGYSQKPETPLKFSPSASPAHTGYVPVRTGAGSRLSPVPVRTEDQDAHRPLAESSAPQTTATEYDTFNVKLAGASDCLHSSEGCFQFPIKKDNKGMLNQSKDDFSTLPLDLDTTESCSVYTSDKLNL
ncbi:uncharacterized protein LOC143011960 [Genypterus blacodes]|uniref:uncharacterized protein LOC143011960 n=1 Tax=Genypterus blacodes TaxID=154954 RepID=UPI003F769639